MKSVVRKIGSGYLVVGILILIGAVAFAASILFFTQHKSTVFEKKTIFASDMNIASNSSAVGPGDTVAFAPTVHNDAIEQMHAFLKLTMPIAENEELYEFTLNDGWMEIEKADGISVYAYVGSNKDMCVLDLDENTPLLTTQLNMRSISNATYASIEVVNVSVDNYVIGIDVASTNPDEAWNYCKNVSGV